MLGLGSGHLVIVGHLVNQPGSPGGRTRMNFIGVLALVAAQDERARYMLMMHHSFVRHSIAEVAYHGCDGSLSHNRARVARTLSRARIIQRARLSFGRRAAFRRLVLLLVL